MKAVSCVSILLFLMLPAVFAQTTDSNLTGQVLDASGAVVPNATIEVQNTATGVKFTTVTGHEGAYYFNNLPVGLYNLTAKANGFATLTVKAINLQLNKTTSANLKLTVGQLSTTVEVSGEAIVLDTTTPQLQTTYESRQIVDLPIIENAAGGYFGALNLSLLSAGVASNGGVGQGTGPSVGGQRPMNNNFTIEGVDNNNKAVTGPLVYVPTEATDEFTLLSNQYSAEFGHSTGGQFNLIVKSGTNSMHGSIYEYLQNRHLNAIDQAYIRQGFNREDNFPRFDQNKLGATIGGPIKKDKLFYFGNFEYSPLGQAFTLGSPVYSPTAAGYSLLDAMEKAGSISKTNYDVFKLYAAPAPVQDGTRTTAVNGVNIPIGVLPISGANFTNFYSAVTSIDYNMTNNDQIRGRFIYNRYTALDNFANLPEFWTDLPQRFYLVTLGHYHNFGPKVTNELRLGYNRFSQFYVLPSQQFPGLDKFPNISFDSDLGLNIGPDPNAPQFAIQNTYQITENLNWIVGNHSFKFGADIRNSISPQHFIQRERGDYVYNNLEEYLLDQVPSSLAERNLGDTTYYGNQWATYFYATDTWKIRNNLTAYMGLRYERTTVPETQKLQNLNAVASVPGLIDFRSPQVDNKGWAPRVGLAYTPGKSGNTVIRAGFGLGYDVIFDNVGSTAYPPQLSSTFDAGTRPDIWHAPFLAGGGIAPGSVPVGTNLTAQEARDATSSYLFDQILPYSIQWNLGVSHVFRRDYTFEARYVGTRGVHLLAQKQINNINTPVTATRNLPTYLQRPTQQQLNALTLTLDDLQNIDPIAPQWASAGFDNTLITSWSDDGSSIYHGMALQLTRRLSKGLAAVGSYTWSHNIDNGTATHYSTVLSPRRPQSFADYRAEKATSALDRRQRFTLSLDWDTPWFNGSSSWALKNLVGNWRAVVSYTAESGELVTAQSGRDSNLNYDSAPDRTVINPNGNPLAGSSVTALTNSAGQTVGYLADNPSAMYISAGYGAYANAGRNTIPMPGTNNFDLSFAKKFKITEGKDIEFRADLANAFNHPQYTAGFINSVRLTSQTTTRTFLIPTSAEFQKWDHNFPSNARNIQMALRFTF
jgi:hypothetical protein